MLHGKILNVSWDDYNDDNNDDGDFYQPKNPSEYLFKCCCLHGTSLDQGPMNSSESIKHSFRLRQSGMHFPQKYCFEISIANQIPQVFFSWIEIKYI